MDRGIVPSRSNFVRSGNRNIDYFPQETGWLKREARDKSGFDSNPSAKK